MPVSARKVVRSRKRGGRGVKVSVSSRVKRTAKRGGYLAVRAPQNSVRAM